MKLVKFIVKENIREGYSLKEQIIDSLGIMAFLVFAFMVLVVR